MAAIYLHLDISPQMGGRLFSASAGLSVLWIALCLYLAWRDLHDIKLAKEKDRQQGAANEDPEKNIPVFKRRDRLPSVRTNNLSGFLGVASAITFTAANYPQPQTLSSFLVIIMATCSSLGWVDIEDIDELVPKGIDLATVAVTAILVMDKANTYHGEWLWYHDPNMYCIIALSLEGGCGLLGCLAVMRKRWSLSSEPEPTAQETRRYALYHRKGILPTCILLTSLI